MYCATSFCERENSSNSPAYVRSHTALLAIVQALAYGVYSRDASQYAERIKAFRLK